MEVLGIVVFFGEAAGGRFVARAGAAVGVRFRGFIFGSGGAVVFVLIDNEEEDEYLVDRREEEAECTFNPFAEELSFCLTVCCFALAFLLVLRWVTVLVVVVVFVVGAAPRRPVRTGGGRTMGTFSPFRVIWVLLPIMVDGSCD